MAALSSSSSNELKSMKGDDGIKGSVIELKNDRETTDHGVLLDEWLSFQVSASFLHLSFLHCCYFWFFFLPASV